MRKCAIAVLFLSSLWGCMPPPPGPVTREAEDIQVQAESYLGVPYRYGGTSRRGMDCSGLVFRLWQDVYGRHVPHSVRQLYRLGKPLMPSQAQTGDLVFFAEPGSREPNHVGVVLDGGRFIHASVKKGVIIDRMDSPYYRKRFVGVRRL